MSANLDLFDHQERSVPGAKNTTIITPLRLPAPAQTHSRTSIDAAMAIAPKLPKRRAQVLALYRGDALTDNELIARGIADGMNPNTPRARRVELSRDGLLVEDGERDGSVVWRVK